METINFVDYSLVFLEKSWEWLNNEEIKKLTLTTDFTKEQQRSFFNSLPERTNYFIKGMTHNSVPIGVCGLKNITDKDGEYWGYIGEKDYWGRGIGKEIVKYILDIAKKKCLKSVYLKVSDSNLRAIRLYEKSGFKTESQEDNLITMRLII